MPKKPLGKKELSELSDVCFPAFEYDVALGAHTMQGQGI
jgi:hypothetical protein